MDEYVLCGNALTAQDLPTERTLDLSEVFVLYPSPTNYAYELTAELRDTLGPARTLLSSPTISGLLLYS